MANFIVQMEVVTRTTMEVAVKARSKQEAEKKFYEEKYDKDSAENSEIHELENVTVYDAEEWRPTLKRPVEHLPI